MMVAERQLCVSTPEPVGGRDEDNLARAEISQLFCPDNQIVESCYWKDLQHQLEVPRMYPYVIPLPNSFNLGTL